MRKLSLIAFAGMLALSVASCGGEGETPTATSPSPAASAPASPQASPSPAASAPASPQVSPSTADFPTSRQVVPPQTAQAPTVPGLTQATTPEERFPLVQKGRKDPFAIIPDVRPVPKEQKPGEEQQNRDLAPKPVPSLPAIPPPPRVSAGTGQQGPGAVPSPVPSLPAVPQSPRVNPNGNGNRYRPPIVNKLTDRLARLRRKSTISDPSVGGKPLVTRRQRATPRPSVVARKPITPRPSVVARKPITPRPSVTPSPAIAKVPPSPPVPEFKPELPKLPEPVLARGVEVTGVVQVGGVPQAIVKAPNEITSRYVSVGQRLSNGQVLVKRIEMNEGSNPVVVLEQFGIEVAKGVGERSTPGQQPGTPAAAVPAASRVNAANG